MKKRFLSILITVCMGLALLPVTAFAEPDGLEINETNFPDYYFRTIFVSEFDKDGDGFLSAEEIDAVTSIDCGYVGSLYSVKGIEQFTALTVLKCSGNQISSLDISQNPNLTELYCAVNQLTSLDVSQNPNLTILNCGANQLTSLDVGQSRNLTILGCGGNQLTSLDVSQNPNLIELDCSGNQLTSLDVSQNPNLTELYCFYNQRTFTDINNGMIDLSTLPGFDVNKTSNWNGGTVNGNILYVDDNAETVTYTYDCGNNHSEMFTFIIASNVPADYTVTYQYGDQMVSDTMIHGSDLTLQGDIFTKTGYKQIGWATTDGGDVSYELGGTYADKASITLYPVWSEMSDYAVSFSTNGGSEIQNKANVKWTDKVLDGIKAPTKNGFSFTNWMCGDVTVDENTTYADLAVDDTVMSVTLTAQYQVEEQRDEEKPVITGVEDEHTYCGAVQFTVSDNVGVASVMVGKDALTADENGKYTLDAGIGSVTVSASDKAGNVTSITVTVNADHTGGKASCKDKAICEVCGIPYGEVDSECHTELKHVPEKAATAAAEGNKEYWYCEDCGKYFSDAKAANEITLADTVLERTKPVIIDGDSAAVAEGEKVTMSFRSDAAFSDFIRVELDGEILDEKNYTKKEGSTIIILNADFVATLPAGEHTLSIVSGGESAGIATAKFTVNTKTAEQPSNENTEQSGDTVQTGDYSNPALWFALSFVSGVGLIAAMIYSKKRVKQMNKLCAK